MPTFITSDLHYGHKNIMKYCPWSRGQYQSVEEMNEAITENINNVVREDDTLIIAGDIAFLKPEQAVEHVKALNGKKIIVWGNHDSKLRDSSAWQSSRGLMGIQSEHDILEFTHVVDNIRHKIIVCHFPMRTWNLKYHGSIHLYGHCHSNPVDNLYEDRCADIGLDTNNMMPYNLDDICRTMSARIPKEDRANHNRGEL